MNSTSHTHRAREQLNEIGKRYPSAWRAFDDFRADRGQGLPDWPQWCFAPLAAAYAIVSGGGDNRVPVRQIGEVARLGALGAWRVTQSIYRFDPTLYAELIDTPLDGDLPAEVLYRLPEWCVYIETPGMDWAGTGLYGLWAHLEWDVETHRPELRLLLDTQDDLVPFPVHIGRWPLAEAVEKALSLSRMHASNLGIAVPAEAQGLIQSALPPLVSLLLYLCADEAEIGDGSRRPAHPVGKRTKHGVRLFPADQPTTWDVGTRLGAALRRAYQASETGQGGAETETGRARARAHIRRAHWHTFWAGAGRSERKLKWLAPVPVNVQDIAGLPATVRPVR